MVIRLPATMRESLEGPPAIAALPVHNRHRLNDQQASDVTVAHLGGVLERLFATARLLPGHKTKPCGKVAPTPEAFQGRGEGWDRHGAG
ncbi:MAG: hypothetical protein ACOH2H_24475 [Cypionkella sp.]